MSWDITIVAVIFVSQLYLTWHSIKISISKDHWKHGLIVGFVGLLGLGCTIYGGLRSGRTQQEYQSHLNTIQRNTEKPIPPPTVTVVPPAINFTPRSQSHSGWTNKDFAYVGLSRAGEAAYITFATYKGTETVDKFRFRVTFNELVAHLIKKGSDGKYAVDIYAYVKDPMTKEVRKCYPTFNSEVKSNVLEITTTPRCPMNTDDFFQLTLLVNSFPADELVITGLERWPN